MCLQKLESKFLLIHVYNSSVKSDGSWKIDVVKWVLSLNKVFIIVIVVIIIIIIIIII